MVILPHKSQVKEGILCKSVTNFNCISNLAADYSASQVHMQGNYSLFSDDLKVTHLAPNYHRPPLSSCSYPILCAKIQPVVFDIEEISMFIGVALLYADPIHDALFSYITFTHLLNKLHSIVYTLNLMRHQAFIRLGDKILPYALQDAND